MLFGRFGNLLPCLLAFACGGTGGQVDGPGGEPAPPPIEWLAWGGDVFEQARADGKMVLVDVGIEGCTACRWMYEDTYRNADVVRRVNEHFLAVSVDADVEPDLGERYARWGWPATIIFSPGGKEVLAIRGNKRPPSFVPILDELIERNRAGTLESEAEPIDTTPAAEPTEMARLCTRTMARLERLSDEDNGGWGRARGVSLPPLLHEFHRAHCRGEADRQAHALRTLEGYSRLIDPVWGGVFVAARSPDWTGVIPEKRTVHEAAALYGFAEAYWITGDERWLEHARKIHEYLNDWMLAPDGTFYSTQEDDAPDLPAGMTAMDYYELPDAERRRYGIPPIDHGVYTDQNGLVVSAYVRTYEATRDDQWLAIARRTADVLLERRVQPAGWIAQVESSDQVSSDERMRLFNLDARPYLKPQAHFGLALLALYRVTAEARYFDAARRVAQGMRSTLEDSEGGGFYSTSERDTDALVPRRKPFYDNVSAARFLTALHFYTRDDELKAAAERTVRAVGTVPAIRWRGANIASLALSLEEMALGPVEFSIVTDDPTDERARALHEASARIYEPRKVLHFEAPGRYPDQGEPAVFVCTWEVCSSPITDPAELVEVAGRFARVEDLSACPPSGGGG